VGVFMGGWSAEREISLLSGQRVLQGLLSAGVDAVPVDVSRELLKSLKGDEYDCVFLILHGPGGEDGVVQAYLELLGIPYTGSGVLGSALAMNKLRSKQIWRGLDLPVPDWRIVNSIDECRSRAQEMGLPMVFKPIGEGSSIGVSPVMQPGELEGAFDLAHRYGAVMMEKFIVGRELTVAVLDGEALPVIHIETPREFYDYEAKYFVDSTRYHCPADLPGNVASECQRLALDAFSAVDAFAWGRVDFVCDENNQPWLIEVNTAPGMTGHSLVPMAALEAGLSFETLVTRILECSLERGR
jgi:D-alanine-D-alanine ligase